MAIIIICLFHFVVSSKTTARLFIYTRLHFLNVVYTFFSFVLFSFKSSVSRVCAHAFLSRSLSLPARFTFRNFSIRHSPFETSTNTDYRCTFSCANDFISAANIASIIYFTCIFLPRFEYGKLSTRLIFFNGSCQPIHFVSFFLFFLLFVFLFLLFSFLFFSFLFFFIPFFNGLKNYVYSH